MFFNPNMNAFPKELGWWEATNDMTLKELVYFTRDHYKYELLSHKVDTDGERRVKTHNAREENKEDVPMNCQAFTVKVFHMIMGDGWFLRHRQHVNLRMDSQKKLLPSNRTVRRHL